MRLGILAQGVACALAATTWIASAHPEMPGNPEHGRDVALRACTNCHLVGRKAPPDATRTDVPSFREIANQPGVTAEQLAGRLIVPHPAMPRVSLTMAEVRDVVAYIISLKQQD